ncbi:hypothetical protein [Micromonospora sp. LH3U1]|uniref:hypothetical protein n=1 Tax=Micromonospora sp. LH3U1 TaxID=3018339 RepID=UPI00234BED93|nr:hypothetical protein [Micromonospora sp. LH3U1]WCN79303.1 hypothetical protein PCA76_20025 [Micromonospora sp. LH3U1]
MSMRIAAAGGDGCAAAADVGVSACPEHPVVNSRTADVSAPTIAEPAGIVRAMNPVLVSISRERYRTPPVPQDPARALNDRGREGEAATVLIGTVLSDGDRAFAHGRW